jgi:hypothetical protein
VDPDVSSFLDFHGWRDAVASCATLVSDELRSTTTHRRCAKNAVESSALGWASFSVANLLVLRQHRPRCARFLEENSLLSEVASIRDLILGHIGKRIHP